MGPDKPMEYFPFPNDIATIGNNGERYPVTEKDENTDWYEWIISELLEKKICRKDIFDLHNELVPYFSLDDDEIAYFSTEEKKYEFLHAIKEEPEHNYIYRVWLQFLYDEMVLGKRSPRVLRLASRGDEDANTYRKWDELSEEVSESILNAISQHKNGYVLKDIYSLSETIKNLVSMKEIHGIAIQGSNSLIYRIARRTVKILIAESKEKETTEWTIYNEMKKGEIDIWFDKHASPDEKLRGSDFNKSDLIKWLEEQEIKPPDFDTKSRIVRCLPNTIFYSQIQYYIQSELNKLLDRHIWDDPEIKPGLSVKIPEDVSSAFCKENPKFGHHSINGATDNWKGRPLDWRIKRGSELLGYEILRILVCELKWITLEKGEYADIDLHYGVTENDKTAQKMKDSLNIPTMIYFTDKLMEKIPNGATDYRKTSGLFRQEIHGDEVHSIYRFMASSTKRWMYCEPEDHSLGKKGGFINRISRESILGAKKIENLYNLKLRYKNDTWDTKWPERTKIGITVCEALNNLQRTQWEVNFDFINAITEGFKITHDSVEYHAKNQKITLKGFIRNIFLQSGENKTKLPSFRKKEIQEETKIKRREIENSLSSCYKAIRNGDNVFWHPWACDWRGRFNTINNTLSPQGGDFNKAVIRFKEWKPLGEDGWKWFKVHVCNLMSERKFGDYFGGLDKDLSWDEPDKHNKKSFDARANWTERHKHSIIHICNNIEDLEIMNILELNLEGIIKPKSEVFQRLSAILELKRIVSEYEDTKDWNKIKSGMPIYLDASCNGFQHAAALLENESLAEKVNLLKPDSDESKAQDLYGDIAEEAYNQYKHRGRNCSKLRKFIEDKKQVLDIDDVQIDQISEIFNRNLMKSPTIQVGYGKRKLDNYLGIISGKEHHPPPKGRFSDSDWKLSFVFDAKEAKGSYSNMQLNVPKKGHSETLKSWLKKHLPDEDVDSYNKKRAIEKLIQCEIHPPEKHRCPECEKIFATMSALRSHITATHKQRVWHPESPLYKSAPDYIRDKIDKQSWPSKLQIGFAESVAEDIFKAINHVTDDSFGEIGQRKLNTVQEKLLDLNLESSEDKLLSWKVLDDNGVSIICYKPKNGEHRPVKSPTTQGKANEHLEEAYKLLHPDKNWNDICEIYEIDENGNTKWKSLLAKKLLQKLISGLDNGKFTTKLELAKQCVDNMFSIGYTINVNDDEKKKIDEGEYKTGPTANFIQSLDAAHMRNVINSMADNGIDSFWSVHDCFGTHASDITKMVDIIKVEFVKLHKGRNINWWCKQMYPEWDSSDDDWDWKRLNLDAVLESEFLVG